MWDPRFWTRIELYILKKSSFHLFAFSTASGGLTSMPLRGWPLTVSFKLKLNLLFFIESNPELIILF